MFSITISPEAMPWTNIFQDQLCIIAELRGNELPESFLHEGDFKAWPSTI